MYENHTLVFWGGTGFCCFTDCEKENAKAPAAAEASIFLNRGDNKTIRSDKFVLIAQWGICKILPFTQTCDTIQPKEMDRTTNHRLTAC